MTTFLAPEQAEPVAWEGALEPLAKGLGGGAPPRVSLGRPVAWDAAAAVKGELGRAWTPPADDLAYTLIGLATLHPPGERDGRYAEVSLEAHLRPRYGQGTAVAHDLFPLQQTVPEMGSVTVGLTPALKFAKAIDVKLLEVGVEKAFAAAFPVIQAYGLGEPDPYWQFKRHAQFPLLGSQRVYLVAAGPRDVPLRLWLNLVADVAHRRWGLMRYGQPQAPGSGLSLT